MSQFQVGHRVVVKAQNGYDWPQRSDEFGPMAGHYGKVIQANVGGTPKMVIVHITGKVDGPVSQAIDLGPPGWLFYPHEIEHAD